MSLDINAIGAEFLDRKKKEEEGNSGGSFLENFVKLPEGKGSLVFRFCPPAKKGMFGRDKNLFYQSTRTHRLNGRNFHCPKEKRDGRWEGDCPVCSYIRWLWTESEKKAPDEAERMQNEYRALKPTERFYYNVIVRETVDGEKNAGPQIYSCGIQVHSKVLAHIVGDEDVGIPALGDISDIKSGYDFRWVKTIRKGGGGKGKEYPNYEQSVFEHTSTPMGTPEEVETWLNNLHDLSALRIVKTVEELKHELKIHLGVAKDNRTGFDPSEFQSEETQTQDSAPSIRVESEQTSSASASASSEEPPFIPDAKNEDDGGDVVADEDFLKQLRDLG